MTFVSTSNRLQATSHNHSFNRELSKKLSNNSALHRLSCSNRRGRSVRQSGVYWQTSNLSRSFGTSPISLTLSFYTECNAHSVVICKGIGSKQHTPLTQQCQGNHVSTNECVWRGQNVAGPGWDDTSTGGWSRDWEWNQWRSRGTIQNQEVVTNIALWKYKPRSSHETWSLVLSNWNSMNKALSCLTMLSCPRCGSGNLKDRKITQHESYLILHGSKYIVQCTKRHIGKEVKVQFIDGWLTLLLSFAMRTFHTTLNVTSRMCDSGYKLSKKNWNIFITSIHGLVYFHQNTKEVFKEFLKTKDGISLKQHQRFFLECIILIIIDDINVKVISITCISFIQ